MSNKGSFLVGEADSGLALQRGVLADRRPPVRNAIVRAGGPNLIGGPAKRLFDILFSCLALIFMLPILVGVALLVKLTSRGPALFWSPRDDGRGGTFLMPKFRTMQVGAPLQPREQLSDAQAKMTRPGAVLRQTSVDELPQLLAVLLGKMSLIGPRPLLPDDPAAELRRQMPGNATARPGLTGLAQVSGRNSVRPRRKVRYDRFYIDNWSWTLDLWILARTIRVVIMRSGVW